MPEDEEIDEERKGDDLFNGDVEEEDDMEADKRSYVSEEAIKPEVERILTAEEKKKIEEIKK